MALPFSSKEEERKKEKMEKLETDIEIKASAEKFHEVFCSRPHHIASMCSDNIPKTEHHDGELGTEGAIIVWHYVIDGKVQTAKTLVEKIDAEKNAVRFKIIEGDLLKEFKSFVSAIQVSPKGQGSVVHWVLEYEKINHQVAHPESILALATWMAKEIDATLAQA